jgi:hypothetical protein
MSAKEWTDLAWTITLCVVILFVAYGIFVSK